MVKQLQAELKAEEDFNQLVDQFEEDFQRRNLAQEQRRNRPSPSTGSVALSETHEIIDQDVTNTAQELLNEPKEKVRLSYKNLICN